MEDPAKHGRKQSQREEHLILPPLTQLTGQHGEQPSRNELSNPKEWENGL